MISGSRLASLGACGCNVWGFSDIDGPGCDLPRKGEEKAKKKKGRKRKFGPKCAEP